MNLPPHQNRKSVSTVTRILPWCGGVLAAIQLAPEGGFRGFGPLGLEGKSAGDAPGLFTQFISSTVGVISVIAFIWFVFLLLTGAFGLMTAGGDKAQVESARKRITSGVIGLVVVIAAIFIIDLIGTLFGVPDILNPSLLIERLGPSGPSGP